MGATPSAAEPVDHESTKTCPRCSAPFTKRHCKGCDWPYCEPCRLTLHSKGTYLVAGEQETYRDDR